MLMKNTTKRKREIKFQINNLQKKVKINSEEIEEKIKKLSKILLPPPSNISVVFLSNRRITTLNKKFLGRNQPTDVMSFLISKNYGEIIISAEKAEENSKIYKNTLEEEILYLIIHGFLHLKGYRDYTEKEFENMKKRQDRIFKKLKNML